MARAPRTESRFYTRWARKLYRSAGVSAPHGNESINVGLLRQADVLIGLVGQGPSGRRRADFDGMQFGLNGCLASPRPPNIFNTRVHT